jgi:hypothetical protein
MTTMTALNGTSIPADRRPAGSQGRFGFVVGVALLVTSTLLVAGYLEYLGWSILLRDSYPDGVIPFTEVWGSAFLGGMVRTGGGALAVGLLPVAVLLSVPRWRPRSHLGILALLGAGAAAFLTLIGIVTASGL